MMNQQKSHIMVPGWILAALIVVLGLLMLGDLALAGTPVEKSGPAPADGVVFIEVLAGSVTVTGWDKDEIKLTGTLDEKAKELRFETGKKSRIEVVYPRRIKNIKEGSDLEILVPKGCRLEIECVSASIDIDEVSGEIGAESVSGYVKVTADAAEVRAESISGSVTVEGDSPVVEVQCISGMAIVRGKVASVDANSVSGDIDVACDAFTDLSIESISGEVNAAGDLAKNCDVSIDVHSGDVDLTVPGGVSADFEVSTFSGDIDNDFGVESERTGKYAPGQDLEFTNGDGSADVNINTFSGDVTIRKK